MDDDNVIPINPYSNLQARMEEAIRRTGTPKPGEKMVMPDTSKPLTDESAQSAPTTPASNDVPGGTTTEENIVAILEARQTKNPELAAKQAHLLALLAKDAENNYQVLEEIATGLRGESEDN